MPATLLAKCPGCKKVVRIREDWADKTVRCKVCGMICQAKPSPALLAKRAAISPPQAMPPVVAAVPVAQPMPAVPPPASHAPVDINPFAFASEPNAWAGIEDELPREAAAPVFLSNYRRRKRSLATTVFISIFLLACVGGTAAAIVVLGPKVKEKLDRPVRWEQHGKEKRLNGRFDQRFGKGQSAGVGQRRRRISPPVARNQY